MHKNGLKNNILIKPKLTNSKLSYYNWKMRVRMSNKKVKSHKREK